MGANALTKIYYSDCDTPICSMYSQYNSYPKQYLEMLSNIFNNTRNTSWEYIIPDIIVGFKRNQDRIKLVQEFQDIFLHEDATLLRWYKLRPIEKKFKNPEIKLIHSVEVEVYYLKDCLFKGSVYDATKYFEDKLN